MRIHTAKSDFRDPAEAPYDARSISERLGSSLGLADNGGQFSTEIYGE
jgi:hypothetical protein